MASGRGSNLQAIINAIERCYLNVKIAVVISDNKNAKALERARKHGIEAVCIEPFDDKKLIECLEKYKPDLICLAGFMRVLGREFVKKYENRLMNIHPSLLPSFPGLHAHRQVLKRGVKFSGCTVHFVTEEVDAGPIILQAQVPVLEGDDEDSLAERVLEYEHVIYPEAIRLFSENKLKIENGKVKILEENKFPSILNLNYKKILDLRYGENPHQKGAYYGLPIEKLGGKELSYNNILDLDAVSFVSEVKEPCAVIVKHTNPCGVAVAENILKAYKLAYKTDPLSAFGGIVGLNKKVDEKTAKEIAKTFIECVLAPEYDDKALDILKQKKNLRIIKSGTGNGSLRVRSVGAGLLVQEKDNKEIGEKDLKTVSRKKPTKKQLEDLLFAWRVVKNAKSNAVVLAKNKKTLGLGCGHVSRVDAVQTAIRKAKSTKNCVLASEAFFPFPDAVKLAAKKGIKAIIQPGGSVRDEEIIKEVDKNRMVMLFTGFRCFRH